MHAEYEPESEDNKISRNFLYKLDLDRDTASRISAGEQKQIRLCWRRQQQGPDTSPNGEPYYYEMEFWIRTDLRVDVLLGRFKPGTGPESSDPFRELQGLGTPKGWLRKAKKSLSWASDKQHQKQEHGKFSSPPAQAIIQAPLRVAAPENNGDDEQGSEVLEGWVNVAHSSGGRNNEEEARPAGSDAEIEPSRGTELFDNQNGSVTPKRGEDDHGIVARGIPKSADALKASESSVSSVVNNVPPKTEPSVPDVLVASPRDSTDSQLSSFGSEERSQSSTTADTTVRPESSNNSIGFNLSSNVSYFEHQNTLNLINQNEGHQEGLVVLPQRQEPEHVTAYLEDQLEAGRGTTSITQNQEPHIHKHGFSNNAGGYKLIKRGRPRSPSMEREANEYWTWDPEKRRHYHLNSDQTRDYYDSDSE